MELEHNMEQNPFKMLKCGSSSLFIVVVEVGDKERRRRRRWFFNHQGNIVEPFECYIDAKYLKLKRPYIKGGDDDNDVGEWYDLWMCVAKEQHKMGIILHAAAAATTTRIKVVVHVQVESGAGGEWGEAETWHGYRITIDWLGHVVEQEEKEEGEGIFARGNRKAVVDWLIDWSDVFGRIRTIREEEEAR